ncbi:carbohydrate ABC transporter permease [Rubricoccus marinus]|uniref:carbohydrate ABC transporter permease n=1 Tax=Rubricoccus marinus TaxID=716817 RepID=UPI001C532E82|nr:sugar ABC transporter permease [Rubricoccus marinus]
MLSAPTDAAGMEAASGARGPAPTPPKRGMSEATRHKLFLAFLLVPTAVIVLAVVAFPFLYNVALSLSDANIYTLRDWKITGFGQYASVMAEPAFWGVFLKTIIWTVVNVAFHVGLGVFLAVVLHQKFIKGKPAWRILLILPWAVPQYITALTWRGMFNYEYGAVNLFMNRLFSADPVAWLTDPTGAFMAAIITNIWLGFPFMMVIALGGLQSIPGELYEAADVDGASAWVKFRRITAPLLRPVMIPAITLGAVWTFNNINVIWLVSNGGEPNEQTHILVSYVYEAAFGLYRFGWAAALSMVIFAVLFVFTQAFLNRTNATESMY